VNRSASHVHIITLLAVVCFPSSLAALRFHPPRDYIDSVLVEQAAAGHIDYSAAYEAALHHRPAGLALLFRATLYTDAAGGEEHSTIIWEQLRAWGDSAFSAVLRRQSRSVRQAVRCALDFAADGPWVQQNPETAKLAELDPMCGHG
jgi:hypothetical protein